MKARVKEERKVILIMSEEEAEWLLTHARRRSRASHIETDRVYYETQQRLYKALAGVLR